MLLSWPTWTRVFYTVFVLVEISSRLSSEIWRVPCFTCELNSIKRWCEMHVRNFCNIIPLGNKVSERFKLKFVQVISKRILCIFTEVSIHYKKLFLMILSSCSTLYCLTEYLKFVILLNFFAFLQHIFLLLLLLNTSRGQHPLVYRIENNSI